MTSSVRERAGGEQPLPAADPPKVPGAAQVQVPGAPDVADSARAADSDGSHDEQQAPSYSPRAVFEAVLEQPALPGDRELERRRGVLLMRAKGEPTFFVRVPKAELEAGDHVTYYQHRLAETQYPWDVLEQLLPIFRARPKLGRQVLLREGYLYTTAPELAYALVSQVRAEHLFHDKQIWVQRGARVMRASRSKGVYTYDDGPLAGQPVRLLLFDRLGSGKEPTLPALHRDFRALAYELGFDRARIRHLTEQRIVADLRYAGSVWVPTLLKSEGALLQLEFEHLEDGDLEQLRAHALERVRGVQALRHAMLLQIHERLPFDEPKNEVGQEDGKLRRSFRFVYEQGRDWFKIRNDPYPVFDAQGRPLAPQVCIDFLLDTFERASGTWWAPRGEARRLTRGRLNFEDYVPRDILRRAKEFITFAEDNPELFVVAEVPAQERVPQGDKQRFFAYLSEHPDLFIAGDIAVIRGLTPWDDESEHYHSFFIYETDPLSGVPIAIAGNAGTPALWSWESEARRTPLRTLRLRVRPSGALLERVAGEEPLLAPTPPPLVAGFSPSA